MDVHVVLRLNLLEQHNHTIQEDNGALKSKDSIDPLSLIPAQLDEVIQCVFEGISSEIITIEILVDAGRVIIPRTTIKLQALIQ